MNMCVIKQVRPIPFDTQTRVTQLAFDGCHYYFTLACEKKILKTDCNFCVDACYDTSRVYNCLCYDTKECCFWASAKGWYNRIFKLDCQMREIDCLTLAPCLEARGEIMGLSYCCCENSLMIAFAASVMERKKNSEVCQLRYQVEQGFLTGVLCISPGLLVTTIRGDAQYLDSVDASGEVKSSYCMEDGIVVQSMVYQPSGHLHEMATLGCLAMKRGTYPYLYEFPLSSFALGFAPCSCNALLDGSHCCCCEGGACHPERACSDVMESIALMEAALAHILNAEGEKLQKVLAESDNLEEIMCVNKEINRTIVNATHLEHLLYEKLSILSELCPETDCDVRPCTCCDPFPCHGGD